jgi:hypothetical protein
MALYYTINGVSTTIYPTFTNPITGYSTNSSVTYNYYYYEGGSETENIDFVYSYINNPATEKNFNCALYVGAQGGLGGTSTTFNIENRFGTLHAISSYGGGGGGGEVVSINLQTTSFPITIVLQPIGSTNDTTVQLNQGQSIIVSGGQNGTNSTQDPELAQEFVHTAGTSGSLGSGGNGGNGGGGGGNGGNGGYIYLAPYTAEGETGISGTGFNGGTNGTIGTGTAGSTSVTFLDGSTGNCAYGGEQGKSGNLPFFLFIVQT